MMMKRTWMIAAMIGSAVGATTFAGAQPAGPPAAPVTPGDGSAASDGSAAGSGSAAAPAPVGTAGSGSAAEPASPYDAPAAPAAPAATAPPAPPAKPRPPDPHVEMPQALIAPTGFLLPAAVIYSRTGLDTGGGFVSDNRVGLGDVAEFGVSTIDEIRAKNMIGDRSDHLQPYFAATFRMGVAEDRLFGGQPGMVLGFRKSFEETNDSEKTRVAELTFVASKHLGPRAAIHVGGSFWDASLQGPTGPETALHDHTVHGLGDQVRPFGAIQVRPLERSEIMVAFDWAPEFCYLCGPKDQIRLRPELAWGVRYEIASWIQLESGVRVPDIGNANLLDAQIFGAVTFVSWGLRHAVDSVK